MAVRMDHQRVVQMDKLRAASMVGYWMADWMAVKMDLQLGHQTVRLMVYWMAHMKAELMDLQKDRQKADLTAVQMDLRWVCQMVLQKAHLKAHWMVHWMVQMKAEPMAE